MRHWFGRDGENELTVAIDADAALMPAGFGLHSLVYRQRVEELVGNDDDGALRHFGERVVPKYRHAGAGERVLLLGAQHWADLDQMNDGSFAESRHHLHGS